MIQTDIGSGRHIAVLKMLMGGRDLCSTIRSTVDLQKRYSVCIRLSEFKWSPLIPRKGFSRIYPMTLIIVRKLASL